MKIFFEEDEPKIGAYTGKKFKIGNDTWVVDKMIGDSYSTTCIDGDANGEQSTIEVEDIESMDDDGQLEYKIFGKGTYAFFENNLLYLIKDKKVESYKLNKESLVNSLQSTIVPNVDSKNTFMKNFLDGMILQLTPDQYDKLSEKIELRYNLNYNESKYKIFEQVTRGKMMFTYSHFEEENYTTSIWVKVVPPIKIQTTGHDASFISHDIVNSVFEFLNVKEDNINLMKSYVRYGEGVNVGLEDLPEFETGEIDGINIYSKIYDVNEESVTLGFECEIITNSGFVLLDSENKFDVDTMVTSEDASNFIDRISESDIWDIIYNDIKKTKDMLMTAVKNANNKLKGKGSIEIGLAEKKIIPHDVFKEMIRKIVCPQCNGKGEFAHPSQATGGLEPCDMCGGSGFITDKNYDDTSKPDPLHKKIGLETLKNIAKDFFENYILPMNIKRLENDESFLNFEERIELAKEVLKDKYPEIKTEKDYNSIVIEAYNYWYDLTKSLNLNPFKPEEKKQYINYLKKKQINKNL